MVRTIAVSNLKGGSAKSTTVITLGAALAELGQQVLLVDVDGQGHTAEGYALQAGTLETTMADVFTGDLKLAEVVRQLRETLWLAPSNLRLSRIEPQLINQIGREAKLDRAIKPIQDDYDFILIDCPPSMGIYTVNALMASSEVLIPMTAEYFAMTGVSMLLETLGDLRRGLDHEIAVAGIIPSRMNRTVNARDVIHYARQQLPDTHFFPSVPEAVAVREATVAGQPVTEYAPDSAPAKAYRAIAKELLDAS